MAPHAQALVDNGTSFALFCFFKCKLVPQPVEIWRGNHWSYVPIRNAGFILASWVLGVFARKSIHFIWSSFSRFDNNDDYHLILVEREGYGIPTKYPPKVKWWGCYGKQHRKRPPPPPNKSRISIWWCNSPFRMHAIKTENRNLKKYLHASDHGCITELKAGSWMYTCTSMIMASLFIAVKC